MKLRTNKIVTTKPLYILACKKHIQHKFTVKMLEGLKELNEAIPSLMLPEDYRGEWEMPEIEVVRKSYAFYPLDFPAVYIQVDLEAEFEDLIDLVEEIEPNQIYKSFFECWFEKDILCFVQFRITAKMDPAYKTTLYNLGHIRMSSGYTTPPMEKVFCQA